MQAVFVSAVILVIVATVEGGFGGGHSHMVRKQDDYGNYAFSYDIHGHGGSNGRKESGGPHGVVGTYYLGVGDGRHRSVQYVADKAGFRAQIKTNEPGTKTSYAAAAAFSSANGKSAPSGGLYGAAHYVSPVYASVPHGYGHAGYGHGGYGHGGHAVSYATHGLAGHHGGHYGGHHGHYYG